MERPVKVACVQVEPVVLDREATLGKLEQVAAEAAGNGTELVVFPETFVPVYPSSVWAKAFAGWDTTGAKETFARLAQDGTVVDARAFDVRLRAIRHKLADGLDGRDNRRIVFRSNGKISPFNNSILKRRVHSGSLHPSSPKA